jgi:multimeric flavodoxin WrbA
MNETSARSHVLEMIQKAAEKAAEKGVEVEVKYSEFGIAGQIEVTVTARPVKSPEKPSA